ncbi:MAG: glycosyltransferase, partial [Anaerolineales bacterium]|nr:glycosyltransferase [Anaerolineales bacterium]
AEACLGGLSVFAGEPRSDESILSGGSLTTAHFARSHNTHILRGRAYLCYQRGLMDWLEAWQPDLLVMEANPRYLSSRQAIRWMRRGGRRVIGWGLGAPGAARRGWRLWVLGRYLRGFDALIAYSQTGAEQYAALGFPQERIFVAHNAAASAPLEMPHRPPPAAGPGSVLYVGRLVAQKRVDLLLHACGSLTPRPRLVIIGDGPERRQLQRLARQVCPQAEFRGTQVGEALQDCFRQAELFVLPGTGGLALQQAMSQGLPLVAGRGDGTQADLVTPDNGWIFERDEPAALASALRQALADPARLRRMGAESYRLVREEFNPEIMAEAFVRAFRSLSVDA